MLQIPGLKHQFSRSNTPTPTAKAEPLRLACPNKSHCQLNKPTNEATNFLSGGEMRCGLLFHFFFCLVVHSKSIPLGKSTQKTWVSSSSPCTALPFSSWSSKAYFLLSAQFPQFHDTPYAILYDTAKDKPRTQSQLSNLVRPLSVSTPSLPSAVPSTGLGCTLSFLETSPLFSGDSQILSNTPAQNQFTSDFTYVH